MGTDVVDSRCTRTNLASQDVVENLCRVFFALNILRFLEQHNKYGIYIEQKRDKKYFEIDAMQVLNDKQEHVVVVHFLCELRG